MTQKYGQVLLRLPRWLYERIAQRADATGRTTTGEIREALIRSYGERGDPELHPMADKRRGEP